mgnify:CR=1 FL=1
MIKVAPSILSADFVNLERDIRHLQESGADYVHIDVMDGLFVPNITIGIPVVAAIRKITDLPLDVHLMIDRPIRYVEQFCDAGADIVTYGAPVLPGAMFLVSYLDGVPVCGLPGCVMYAKRTIFDLLLPRLLADDAITAEDIARLGEGGLCLGCAECHWPNCGFGHC